MPTEYFPDGTFKTEDSVDVPDVLDMLIVGGGPAGTAAAFRAQELGLDALVIDYDDLMKRIRDYAKDKLILPHFGGGDKMKFPKGGELVNRLHFDPIDKDDMCAEWKQFYREHNVPAKVGVELTGAEPLEGGGWEAVTWNHKTNEEERYPTRHLVIAMGRGVPRRFDIPGNTDGVAYRLDDPDEYVGHPVCIIGGGTSAAEAVIAVSNSKNEAEDDCPVYWSYRGEQMPKVSKALSDEFFDAYVRNGNIRYLPNSEPELVTTGPDRNEFLSLRVDRKILDGRPIETPHLEFPKHHCIACIGEDIPEDFLNSLGVHMVKGGPNNKKRMAVTPLLETEQPNLYLIGDILSQAYLETEDFDADPVSYQEVKHRGNIKSALRDGVFIAEVVKQKLEGRQTIQVDLTFADEDEDDQGPEEPEEKESESFLKTMVEGEAEPDESVSDERAVDEEEAILVRITPSGVEEDEFTLQETGATTIGRTEGDLTFPEDNRLSSPHASISHTPDGYVLRDDGSSTGTFLKLQPGDRTEMTSGALLQAGGQFLLFGREDDRPHVVQYDQAGQKVERYDLSEGSYILGRSAPDIVLDPDDKILSRRHLALEVGENGRVTARDLDSLNGTFLRVREGVTIEHGDIFRVGQKLFRLSLEEVTPASSTVFRMKPDEGERVEEQKEEEEEEEPAEPSTEPSVTVQPEGTTIPVDDGQTILDALKGEDLIEYECESGFCGMDALRVVSGGEHLSTPGDQEEDTLQTLCDLEPGNEEGQCRLACMAEATGPVVVKRADE